MDRRQMLCGLMAATVAAQTTRRTGGRPRNVIFNLSDDHRYDAMGSLKCQEWLEAPQMDRMAREGCHFRNAFVTTSLCSPSRATILTGEYAHKHRIVDNITLIPPGTVLFPHYLQRAGYATAFIAKWQMGGASDDPQRGFDRCVSFRGHGSRMPCNGGLNVDGKRVPQKGYITDELTDHALDWLRRQDRHQPYFLYLSHKAVHGAFVPTARHQGKYAARQFKFPPRIAPSDEMAQGLPMWVQNQRNSHHGVEFPYHSELGVDGYYKRYAETLCGVDESIGAVFDELKKRGELDSTLVLYMGDNGFAFGEHGLIDKRTAYDESMRVLLLARCSELFEGGRVSGADGAAAGRASDTLMES